MVITEREKEIIKHLALSNKQIAERLNVSITTVKTHLRNLGWKLCLDEANRTMILAIGLKLGVISKEQIVLE